MRAVFIPGNNWSPKRVLVRAVRIMPDEKPRNFFQHARQWVYWNGKLYYFQDPRHFRALYKSLKPFKKFGISDPFIVYQMSKVGSSTIVTSLQALDLDVPIHHIHFLNDFEGIERSTRAAHADARHALAVIQEGRALRREIDLHPQRKWNIVCLVRLPISRDVSSFFQALSAYLPDALARYQVGALSVQEIQQVFVEKHFHGTDEYLFDTQVTPVFGFDVYATPFPKELGYQVYESRNARMLLVRLEDLNRVAEQAFEKAFGIPNFKLIRANVGEGKGYAEIYRAFQQQAGLPESYIQEMVSTRYVRHFYSPQELEAEARAWSRTNAN